MALLDRRPDMSKDNQLRERAAQVIPGGMWGHQRAAAVPAEFPQFFDRAKGAIVRDVDGNEYIDFMCAWGPIILGHQYEAVDRPAQVQSDKGLCFNGPTEQVVELAELVVDMVDHAEWALFQKNGSDAMTGCVTIARAGTGCRKVLVARGAYHGAVPWCSPSLLGVTTEDRAHIQYFEWNDIDSLKVAVVEAGNDLAAIVVSALRHDLGIAMEFPTVEFARAVRTACDETGAALIVDDVRAGFRLDLGGSWNLVGIQPDLSAWSKAIANGHPLAMITGNERFRTAAKDVFLTGSFWYSGAPMAAAIATLRELRRIDGPNVMRLAGERLRAGLDEQAAEYGFELIQSGPPAMPLLQFKGDDEKSSLGEQFCIEALRRGVYMHHRHNMFLSCAHTDAVIDAALAATEGAFAAIAASGQRHA